MSLWNSIMRTIKEKSIRIETAREVFEAKDEYFIRNGAILLEKQITCNQGRDVEPIKIFSAKEIQQATNNYDPNLILGSAIAMVYKGTLDDREVAIKVRNPTILWPMEKMVDFFLNQVTVKQLISHKNVVRLYGCCLETEIPMLVFELISNGTLFDHLHGQCNEIPCRISWLDRVRIATETSYALCYMHYENRILQIVDDRVLSEGSSEDIQAFSELALRCVKNKGDERPTMREVTLELSRIQHLIRSKQNNGSGSAQTQLA
uniref:Protein kinase domain-containing protein n=1 Tax=Fagus sylvatica TaxID=28930 RepID=A0A2N9FXJ9_FAGSY